MSPQPPASWLSLRKLPSTAATLIVGAVLAAAVQAAFPGVIAYFRGEHFTVRAYVFPNRQRQLVTPEATTVDATRPLPPTPRPDPYDSDGAFNAVRLTLRNGTTREVSHIRVHLPAALVDPIVAIAPAEGSKSAVDHVIAGSNLIDIPDLVPSETRYVYVYTAGDAKDAILHERLTVTSTEEPLLAVADRSYVEGVAGELYPFRVAGAILLLLLIASIILLISGSSMLESRTRRIVREAHEMARIRTTAAEIAAEAERYPGEQFRRR